MRRFARWLVFVLVAWLPLQAAALPLLVGCCPQTAGVVQSEDADTPCHQHAVLDLEPTPAQDGRDGPDDVHGANPGHLCCPHFSAAPVHRFGVFAAAERFDAPAHVVHGRSHIPEQPQRPPRA